MFRENFEQLQLRLYQLDRLIEANLPDLHVHFQDQGKNLKAIFNFSMFLVQNIYNFVFNFRS